MEDPDSLNFDVLRRQVEHWLGPLAEQGPVPMDVSTLQSAVVPFLSKSQLEEALLVLRNGGGKKGKGKNGQGQGQGRQGINQIDGKG